MYSISFSVASKIYVPILILVSESQRSGIDQPYIYMNEPIPSSTLFPYVQIVAQERLKDLLLQLYMDIINDCPVQIR